MTKVKRLACLARDYTKSLRSFLTKYKFKRLHLHEETKIWGNKYLIIKEIGTKVLTIPPSSIVETEEVFFYGRNYLIQPRVKPGTDKAARILHDRHPMWIDAGKENCGWHKKQPVIIDW